MPDTETAIAAKSLSAAPELQDPSLQSLRRSCQQKQPYLTKAETAWLYTASLCLSLLPWDQAFFGNQGSTNSCASPGCEAQLQQHAGVHVALGPAPAVPSPFPWISCRRHSPAPRGAPHPQNGALSLG